MHRLKDTRVYRSPKLKLHTDVIFYRILSPVVKPMCMQAMKGFGFAVALWQQWRLDVSQPFLTQPHILDHFDDDCVDDVDDGDYYFHYYTLMMYLSSFDWTIPCNCCFLCQSMRVLEAASSANETKSTVLQKLVTMEPRIFRSTWLLQNQILEVKFFPFDVFDAFWYFLNIRLSDFSGKVFAPASIRQPASNA